MPGGKTDGKYTRKKSAYRHTHIVEHNGFCGVFLAHTHRFHKIGASPRSANAFNSAGADECKPGKPYLSAFGKLEYRHRFLRRILIAVLLFGNPPPERKRKHRYRGNNNLNEKSKSVSAAPIIIVRKRKRHKERAHGNANAVKAMKKIHMHRFIMKRNVIIKSGIYSSAAQAERYGEKAKKYKII